VNTFNQSANLLNQSVMQWSLYNSHMSSQMPLRPNFPMQTPITMEQLHRQQHPNNLNWDPTEQTNLSQPSQPLGFEPPTNNPTFDQMALQYQNLSKQLMAMQLLQQSQLAGQLGGAGNVANFNTQPRVVGSNNTQLYPILSNGNTPNLSEPTYIRRVSATNNNTFDSEWQQFLTPQAPTTNVDVKKNTDEEK